MGGLAEVRVNAGFAGEHATWWAEARRRAGAWSRLGGGAVVAMIWRPAETPRVVLEVGEAERLMELASSLPGWGEFDDETPLLYSPPDRLDAEGGLAFRSR